MIQRRQFKGIAGQLVVVYCVAVTLYHILYISGSLIRLGVWLEDYQHRSLSLALFLALTILLCPATKASKDRLPWYDIVLMLVSLGAAGYPFLFWPRLLEIWGAGELATTVEVVLCFMLVGVILEAVRRVIGWGMVGVALVFFAYIFLGQHLPAIIMTKAFSLERIAGFLYVFPEGIFGIVVSVASTLIVSFILFGQFLVVSRLGLSFINLAFCLVGHLKGGPAKIAVVASCMMGSLSGSGVANVVTTGTFTIPLMKKNGYLPHFAAAVEAVSSNGGMIMPPVMGAVAFIMAELLEIPYWKIVIVCFIPAYLYYFAVFIQVHAEAVRLDLRGIPRSELPPLKKTLLDSWQFLVPLGVLIYMLGVLQYRPEMAALYGTASIILCSMVKKETRMGPRQIIEGLDRTAKGIVDVMAACAGAGIILGSIMATGLGLRLTFILTELAGGNLFLLLILAASASFILGMGTTAIPCYLIVAMLVCPVLIKMGIFPLGAHLFAFYWGIVSFITPPVAICAFAAAGLAQANMWKTGWTATRLGFCAFTVPFLFVYKPALLLHGSPLEIVLAIAISVVFVTFLAFGLSGYLLNKRLNVVGRSLCFLVPIILALTLFK